MILRSNNKRKTTHIEIKVNRYLDPDDDWFLDICWVTNKSKKIKKEITIIRSDLDSWLDSFLKNDWYIENT